MIVQAGDECKGSLLGKKKRRRTNEPQCHETIILLGKTARANALKTVFKYCHRLRLVEISKIAQILVENLRNLVPKKLVLACTRLC